MAIYSEEFKRTAVQKFMLRGARSVSDVSTELGVSEVSFYLWKAKYASSLRMNNENRRPQDWSATEKFAAVIEYEKLNEAEQGEFLRSKGLHSDHIIAWKKCMQNGLESPKKSQEARSEIAQLKADNKELERDLHKKNKALAEVSALLVLKKKADLIWGSGENE